MSLEQPTMVDRLDACVADLKRDQSIEAAESVEAELKRLVEALLTSDSDPQGRASAAAALGRVGLIPKIKSYAIKAAHPSGYAIFLQEPGRGFSFQLHPTSKMELVHILVARGGSRVFKMPYERWRETVDARRMASWLAGGGDAELDRFSVVPEPGDVFTVETTSDVHTVLGCYLEEFATNSGDQVHRLYDQNVGAGTPAFFSNAYMEKELEALPDVTPRRRWELTSDGWTSHPVEPVGEPGALHWQLGCGPLTAGWLRLQPHRQFRLECRDQNILFGRVFGGSGRLMVETQDPTPVTAGDCFVLLPGQSGLLETSATDRLALSMHETPTDLALFS